MNKELLDQTTQIFDTEDKWNALFELYDAREQIGKHWLQKAAAPLRAAFDNHHSWECSKWEEEYEYSWKLKQDNPGPLRLGIGWQTIELHLYIEVEERLSNNSLEKAYDIANEKRFFPLFEELDLQIGQNKRTGYGSVAQNIEFNPFTSNSNSDTRQRQMQWMASHKTDEFVCEISSYIKRLTDNGKLTELFKELSQRLSSELAITD